MQHILKEFMNTPWAILPEKLMVMIDFLSLRASGVRFDAEEVQSRVGAQSRPVGMASGGVAVIPVFGVISQRIGILGEFSGGTSTEKIMASIKEQLNNSAIDRIVLNIDSPGGSVYGVSELSNFLRQAREEKPITAIANSLAASAAYWIGSSASEFIVTPGGDVGSIGVLTAHQDMSEALEKAGQKVTLISAGKYKTEANPYEPLSEEARAAIQKRVDEYYEEFISSVSINRNVSKSDVKAGFGQGRTVGAKEAKQLGMVDRIATLDETIKRLTSSRIRSNRMNAAKIDIKEKI